MGFAALNPSYGSAIVALALATQASRAADLQVYVSGAPAQVAQSLAARFRDATGDRVVLTSATIAEMQRRLAAGERPDAIILPAPDHRGAGQGRQPRRRQPHRPGAGRRRRGGARRRGPARRRDPGRDAQAAGRGALDRACRSGRRRVCGRPDRAHDDAARHRRRGQAQDRPTSPRSPAAPPRSRRAMRRSGCSTSARSSSTRASRWPGRCRPSCRATSCLPAPCMRRARRRMRRGRSCARSPRRMPAMRGRRAGSSRSARVRERSGRHHASGLCRHCHVVAARRGGSRRRGRDRAGVSRRDAQLAEPSWSRVSSSRQGTK